MLRSLARGFLRKQGSETKLEMETMYRPFVEPIGREETEFFAVGADEHCPKVAVFVGGNPGYAGLYGQFLQKLSQSLGSDWRVLGASLLGHEGSNVHEHKRFTFSDQVEHFCCTLEEIAFGRERLVVLGHSIGAAVGLQAAEQGSLLSDERFSFTLLMPFLEFSELVPGQRRLRYLAWAPWARWVAYIPGRLQMLVALAACGFRMDPLAEEHLERFLSDRSGMGLENVISLARSEFAHLAGAMETHCQILRRLGCEGTVPNPPSRGRK